MLRYKRIVAHEKKSLRGHPYMVYLEEPLVPRIEDRHLDCSVFLYPTASAAADAERIGGCGFLVSVPATGPGWLIEGECPNLGFHHCYVVSNRHVVTKYPVVRLNTHDGHFDVLSDLTGSWIFSKEHDLAVVPIDFNRAHRYLFLSTKMFLTEQIAATHDIGIGDEVFMIGRFISHDGKQRNSPSVRWGHISMMPGEAVRHPSNPTNEQLSFLVEIHSISGYSGSPVLVRPFPQKKLYVQTAPFNTVAYVSGVYTSEDAISWHDVDEVGPWLLGVEWGYINNHDQWQNNTGISGVIPAWFLLDLLNSEELKERRKNEQRRLADRRQGGTTLTSPPTHA
jgi:hypothetical protein